MNLSFLPYCEECGEARVPHVVSRMTENSQSLVQSLGPVTKLISSFTSSADSGARAVFTADRVMAIARLCAKLKIGSFYSAPGLHENTRTLALYEGADARGVTLWTFVLFGAPMCHIAEKEVNGDNMRVLFEIIPRPNGFVSPSLAWMDDKDILKERLMEAQIPCADGGVAFTYEEAQKLFRKIGRPVITKPKTGSRGRHTTLDIRTEDELKKGFDVTQEICKGVIVEAYLKGTVHRVTLVGGEPVATARREYPHVIGDGVHTVSELITIENAQPYRSGTHFRKIDPTHRTPMMLMKQGLTFDSIPEKGRMVILNDKNSRLHGTLTEDVTALVHEDNLELFRRLGTVLGDPIVGVDFMIHDMRRSWKEQEDSGVIECNSMPFIDVHHQVVSGERINVAGYLWDEVFKTSA